MHRLLTTALSLAFLATLATGADAKSCRDAKGKFVKCPPAKTMMMAPKKCRDAKGKFMKCTDKGMGHM